MVAQQKLMLQEADITTTMEETHNMAPIYPSMQNAPQGTVAKGRQSGHMRPCSVTPKTGLDLSRLSSNPCLNPSPRNIYTCLFFHSVKPGPESSSKGWFFPLIGKGVLCEVAIYPFIDNPYILNEHQELRMF
jgi:hypothetical protein